MLPRAIRNYFWRTDPIWKRQIAIISRHMTAEFDHPKATFTREADGRLYWKTGRDGWEAEVRWYPEAPETFRVMELRYYKDDRGEPHDVRSYIGRLLHLPTEAP